MISIQNIARMKVRRSPAEQREFDAQKMRDARDMLEGGRHAVDGGTQPKRSTPSRKRGKRVPKGKRNKESDKAVALDDAPPDDKKEINDDVDIGSGEARKEVNIEAADGKDSWPLLRSVKKPKRTPISTTPQRIPHRGSQMTYLLCSV
jgi:hypothetical protein